MKNLFTTTVLITKLTASHLPEAYNEWLDDEAGRDQLGEIIDYPDSDPEVINQLDTLAFTYDGTVSFLTEVFHNLPEIYQEYFSSKEDFYVKVEESHTTFEIWFTFDLFDLWVEEVASFRGALELRSDTAMSLTEGWVVDLVKSNRDNWEVV